MILFEGLTITHKRRSIVEDKAYYPFGLKIDGITAKAAGGGPGVRYNYQGDFAEEDEETGYNEFALRNFDPQTGRWIQPDPYNEFASGYTGMGNDPVNSVDPDGGCVFFSGQVGFGVQFESPVGADILIKKGIIKPF